jgi:UBX domain-containing protein 1
LSSFYETAPEGEAAEPNLSSDVKIVDANLDSSDDDDDEIVETAATTKKTASKPSSGRQNFATISSFRDAEDKDSDERGQAFYAGGSEHSGQQVLGPPKKKNPIKDMVAEVFRQAQAGNLEQFDPSDNPERADRAQRSSFAGTGYRLGQTDDDTVAVPSTSRSNIKKSKEHDECDNVTIKVFRQGFTVDDGELRLYTEPRNQEFFESIRRNEIPAEFRKQGKSMVHINVEDHLSEEYVKKAPVFRAFGGSGHTLGSPTPPMSDNAISTTTTAATAAAVGKAGASNAENEAKAATELNVNESEATTMLSIRLADGSRLSTRFNLTHTVQDIRQYIVTARPEYSDRSFMLLTTFPNKELSNASDTIQQAGLQNAAILQRMK